MPFKMKLSTLLNSAAALLAGGAVIGFATAAPGLAQERQVGSTQLPTIAFPERPPVPTVTPYPGMGTAYDYSGFRSEQPAIKLPDGFAPIFNGRDLTGWHVSKTARHGHTPDFRAYGGMILGTQQPVGSGGLLITDKKYRNYEVYFEAKADWGADSGVLIRTTEDGTAYQVTLDYLPGGSMGRVIGEGGLTNIGRAAGETAPPPRPAAPAAAPAAGANAPPRAPDLGMSLWKPTEWNSVRIRVEGDNPHITVWINGTQTADLVDPANHAANNLVEAPFAIQVHGGPHRWVPGNFWRWRNFGVKELPAR